MKSALYHKITATFQYKLPKIKAEAYEMRRTLSIVSFCTVALTIMGLS